MNFPSIQQVRHLVAYMQEKGEGAHLYRGTIKIHGTNARITYTEDGMTFGSRNIDNLTEGHYGFVEWAKSTDDLPVSKEVSKPYTVYGEWAGEGIQAGIPYPKTFFPFAVYEHKTECWYSDGILDTPSGQGWYAISTFPTYFVDIDFSDEQRCTETIEKLMEIVAEIDEECPVAKHLHNCKVHGEGMVFVPMSSLNPAHGFKLKGERHKTTKVKKEINPDITSLRELKEVVVTESRLTQGLEHVPLDRKNTGKFVQWVIADIQKEDADLLLDFDPRLVNKAFSRDIAQWFLDRA